MPRSTGIPDTRRTTALLQIDADGSFRLAGAFGRNGEFLRIEHDTRGTVTILRLRGKQWAEASVNVFSSPRGHSVLETRIAFPSDQGGVAAHLSHLSARRFRRDRTLQIETTNKRSGSVVERFRDGSMVTAEGTYENGTSVYTRRKLDRTGVVEWIEEVKAEYSAAPPGDVRSRAARIATMKRSSATGQRLSTTELVQSAGGDQCAARKSRSVQVSDDGTSEDVSTMINPDGSVTTLTVTTFPDGSQTITTVTTNDPFGSLSHSTDTTVVAVSSDGSQGVVSHHVEEGGSDPDAGTSWGHEETTVTTGEGEITDDSAWAVDSAGNLSSTTSHTDADGSVTITTMTTDADGSGTETTSTYDSGGVETGSTTVPVGGGGGNGGNSGGSGGDAGGSGGSGGGGDDNGSNGGGGITSEGEPCDPTEDDDCTPIFVTSERRKSRRIVPEIVAHALDAVQNSLRSDSKAFSDRIGEQIRQHLMTPTVAGERSSVASGTVTTWLKQNDIEAIRGAVHTSYSGNSSDGRGHLEFVSAIVSRIAQRPLPKGMSMNRTLLSVRKRLAQVERITRQHG